MNGNTKITAGDRGGSNALFACLTLITYFVPYRWNAAENYISSFAITKVRVTHTKDVRIRKLGNLSMLTVRGHMHVASYKGCPEYKKQAFRKHVVNKQKSHAAAVGQKLSPNPNHLRHFNLQPSN